MDLVPWPSSEYEAEVDLVLIQTSLALSWKFSSKNTYQQEKLDLHNKAGKFVSKQG